MLTYILRRLLWMIPTLLIILMVNFAMMRMRVPSLVEEMSQGGRGEGGMQADKSTVRSVGAHLRKFRLSGYDLPALLNLRGFESRESLLREIKSAEGGAEPISDSERRTILAKLWIRGTLALEPLAEILADPSLSHWHPPAAEAFVYCALVPRTPEDDDRGESWKATIDNRNLLLETLLIRYRNDPVRGYVSEEPSAGIQAKLSKIQELWQHNREEWQRNPSKIWKATILDTGFFSVVHKLCTGRLYSETRQEYAFTLIGQRWQVTFWLNAIALALAWLISIPLGIRSARRLGTLEDNVTTSGLFLLWSLPSFFVGILLIHHFCVPYQSADGQLIAAWFPHADLAKQGSEWLSTPAWIADLVWHGVLPLLVLTYGSFTALSRYMRGQMLDQLRADYIRTARAKGCSEDRIVYHHALPNSLTTMITLGSHLLADLFGGALVVELLWSVPGLGTLMLDAAIYRDAPLLMATTLISVVLLLIGILIADILYAVVDPRIRGRYV